MSLEKLLASLSRPHAERYEDQEWHELRVCGWPALTKFILEEFNFRAFCTEDLFQYAGDHQICMRRLDDSFSVWIAPWNNADVAIWKGSAKTFRSATLLCLLAVRHCTDGDWDNNYHFEEELLCYEVVS